MKNSQRWSKLYVEELNLDIDITSLKEWAKFVVDNFNPVWQSQWEATPTSGSNKQLEGKPDPKPIGDTKYLQNYGGWSVQTQDKSYVQGWQPAKRYYVGDEVISKPIIPDIEQIHYTDICNSSIINLMEQIKDLGFQPHRSRLALLMPGFTLGWHWDQGICAQNSSVIKIHVPIISNEKNTFESREKIWNLKEGKAYVMNVNQEHNARNLSDQLRFHLVMNAIDTKGVTKFLNA